MGKKIVPAELRNNMSEKVGALEMKSPTDNFKKNMPSIGGKKGKEQMTVIQSPVPFTDAELEQYKYWLAIQSCIPWLYEKPKDKFAKDLLRDFMALYAKIKMAMQAVVPGKVNVSVGKSKADGQDLVLSGGWYDTAQDEADFAISFFSSYISCICGDDALNRLADKASYALKVQRGRVAKLEDEIERRDLRIKDLERAVKKLELKEKSLKRTIATERNASGNRQKQFKNKEKRR